MASLLLEKKSKKGKKRKKSPVEEDDAHDEDTIDIRDGTFIYNFNFA